MRVQQLTLRGFRNIREQTLVPDKHLNFLLGANGQGKTSFIEALGYLSTLRSFRGSKSHEVINWGENDSEIVSTLLDDSGDWKTELKVSFKISPDRHKASKVAFINQKPYRSSTQFLTQRFGSYELGFHAIVFNPSDHDLVRGEPAIRRSYLDRVLAAEDVDYLKTLQKYQRTLEQRNALLKTFPSPSRELVRGFTEPLASYGSLLTLKRLEWIERLGFRLGDIMRRIAPSQRDLKLIYLSNWVPKIENLSIPNNNLGAIHFAGQQPLPSLEILEQAFWLRLSAVEEIEWRTGNSLVGPHRDDWSFLLGDQVLKGHGSQGEVRSALLALKLSEIELFRNRTGHRPLFLLDDFSSELDRERRSFLLRFLSETDLQTFVTTTEEFSTMGKRYWVSNGCLAEGTNEHGIHGVQTNGP